MKKRYLLFIVFLLSLSISCKQQVPKELIGIDSMADILFDISLAEGFTETFLLKDTSLVKDSVYQTEINKVLQFHKTSPKVFSKSYIYYTQEPVLFKQVMDSANARALRYKEEAIKVDNKKLSK